MVTFCFAYAKNAAYGFSCGPIWGLGFYCLCLCLFVYFCSFSRFGAAQLRVLRWGLVIYYWSLGYEDSDVIVGGSSDSDSDSDMSVDSSDSASDSDSKMSVDTWWSVGPQRVNVNLIWMRW